MDHLRSFIRSKSSPKGSSFLRHILNDSDDAIKTDAGDASAIAKLPYEVLENILIFAWHGRTSGLPGNGNFAFHNPRTLHNPSGAPSSSSYGHLLENPHSKLSSAIESGDSFTGDFPIATTYRDLSLVCRRWRKVMYSVARMYVSIPTLHGLQEYARIIGAPYLTGRFPKDSLKAQGKASSRNTVDSHPAGALDDTERALLARRLCRTIHINIPTGNLTMIPSWSDIPVLTLPIQIPTGVTSSLDSLTHIIFTVKEPHPAFFAYLAGGLPSSVKVLDIHISSPYIYKRPVLNRASSNTREADLRSGLSHVNHLLINVLDPLLLACILEGFGSTYSEPSTSQNPQVVAILDEESKAAARRSQIYSSPSLQTLTLHGPHLLTHPTITDTISHSPTIHTLTLYPHAPKVPGDMLAPCNALSVWNAPLALQNEAWLPALERLVVRKPTPEARDEEELAKIKEVCEKRRVQVIVEGPSY